uniref:Uncharacterized protein n=1 Tax=Physcomitrium patens TaxID=3218 RepID=A0A2K1JGW2_PHYPA|nr:hypothetical protein PHYPA_017928 [Physcomitrium patens]
MQLCRVSSGLRCLLPALILFRHPGCRILTLAFFRR